MCSPVIEGQTRGSAPTSAGRDARFLPPDGNVSRDTMLSVLPCGLLWALPLSTVYCLPSTGTPN